jgi:hypothetical protein
MAATPSELAQELSKLCGDDLLKMTCNPFIEWRTSSEQYTHPFFSTTQIYES